MLKRPGLPKRVVRQMSRISMNGGSSGNPTTSISPEVSASCMSFWRCRGFRWPFCTPMGQGISSEHLHTPIPKVQFEAT